MERMPIYLVRWPDLSAALVKASSEDELVEILEEVANPDGCTWSVYLGPLFLEFGVVATPHILASPQARDVLHALATFCEVHGHDDTYRREMIVRRGAYTVAQLDGLMTRAKEWLNGRVPDESGCNRG